MYKLFKPLVSSTFSLEFARIRRIYVKGNLQDRVGYNYILHLLKLFGVFGRVFHNNEFTALAERLCVEEA